jgi:mono/diheme cytochrome c family protein
MKWAGKWARLLAGGALLAAAAAGCGARREKRAFEYMPDMARSPAYKAFAPNPVTRDHVTLQRPVAGTIARGYHPFHYGPGEDEAMRAGRELQNPLHATARTLDEGKGLYGIYCAICHGEQGKGDGPISGKIPPPPAYTSERVMAFPPGRIFHVLTTGSGKMPSYAAQLSAGERWKVVTYVRTSLQGYQEQVAAGGGPGGSERQPERQPAPGQIEPGPTQQGQTPR